IGDAVHRGAVAHARTTHRADGILSSLRQLDGEPADRHHPEAEHLMPGRVETGRLDVQYEQLKVLHAAVRQLVPTPPGQPAAHGGSCGPPPPAVDPAVMTGCPAAGAGPAPAGPCARFGTHPAGAGARSRSAPTGR